MPYQGVKSMQPIKSNIESLESVSSRLPPSGNIVDKIHQLYQQNDPCLNPVTIFFLYMIRFVLIAVNFLSIDRNIYYLYLNQQNQKREKRKSSKTFWHSPLRK